MRSILSKTAGRLARRMTSWLSRKHVDTLPHPPLLPFFGSALQLWMGQGGLANVHKRMSENFQRFGKIYRDRLFQMRSVNLSCPFDVEKMHRNEGLHPVRAEVPVWCHVRTKRNIPLGLVLSNGEEWYRTRRAVDKQLLVLPNVYRYLPQINTIANDALRLMYNEQNHKNASAHVPDLKLLMFRWSTESVCMFLYDQRLGCLSDTPPADAVKFPVTIETMFETTQKLVLLNVNVGRLLFPFTFRKHDKAWEEIFRTGRRYAQKKIKTVREALARGEKPIGFLASLMENKELSEEEMLTVTVDVMTGGVDTTATLATWLLYHLSRNPRCQELLFQEIRASIPKGAPITDTYLRHAPYLKACFRESLRINPVVLVNTRVLAKDVELSGYHAPKGTLLTSADFHMARSAENFDDPEAYKPERWLRDDEGRKEANVKHASNPFGFGVRMCIGRRLAETEVFTLVSQMINQYTVENKNDDVVGPVTSIVMAPRVPVLLKLTPRAW